jgi:hypothetical protein
VQRKEPVYAMKDGQRFVFLRVWEESEGVGEVLDEAEVDDGHSADASSVNDALQSALSGAALTALLEEGLLLSFRHGDTQGTRCCFCDKPGAVDASTSAFNCIGDRATEHSTQESKTTWKRVRAAKAQALVVETA